MKTVNIGELKNQLNVYLRLVRKGEEIIVRDRDLPIARILPYSTVDLAEEERQLVASGAMKLPQAPMDWDKSSRIPELPIPKDSRRPSCP